MSKVFSIDSETVRWTSDFFAVGAMCTANILTLTVDLNTEFNRGYIVSDVYQPVKDGRLILQEAEEGNDLCLTSLNLYFLFWSKELLFTCFVTGQMCSHIRVLRKTYFIFCMQFVIVNEYLKKKITSKFNY